MLDKNQILKIEGLVFGYGENDKLFNNLNLEIQSGNIYGLLGKNGVGKTTLLRIICGLLFPIKGKCEIFNCDPKERATKFLQQIYFLPEAFYTLALTAEEYAKLYSPFYKEFDFAIFDNCLKEFDLPRDKKLNILSYGQKKKFLISFGIATNCRLLILDEPTNGLDIPSKSQFRKLIAGAATEEKTFIISTHQVRDLENLIDPIIILHNGEIVFNYSIATISKHLNFVTLADSEKPKDALFSEKTLNGYRAVTLNENPDSVESRIDLEMLFNAVLTNQAKIKQIFEGK